MPALSRRRFLLTAGGSVATAALLAACTDPGPTPPGSASGSPAPTATPAGPPVWSELAAAVSGTLLLPATYGYPTAAMTENPRFDDAQPLAVLEASGSADVAAGLAFATKYGVPLALRSGGHSYTGASAGGASGTGVSPSLVISTATLTDVTLSADGSTADVGRTETPSPDATAAWMLVRL